MPVGVLVNVCLLPLALGALAPQHIGHRFVVARSRVGCSLCTMTGTEIKVIIAPAAEQIARMKMWPTWGCGVSTFPWAYGETETCYIIEGEVTVTPTDGRAAVTLQAGNMAVFPMGLRCTWDVKVPILKHYHFS